MDQKDNQVRNWNQEMKNTSGEYKQTEYHSKFQTHSHNF